MMAPLLGHEIRPQQLRPPGDRVERRAQFMRDRGEELVLQLIGAFGRLPRRSFTDEQVVALVLDGGAHAIGRIQAGGSTPDENGEQHRERDDQERRPHAGVVDSGLLTSDAQVAEGGRNQDGRKNQPPRESASRTATDQDGSGSEVRICGQESDAEDLERRRRRPGDPGVLRDAIELLDAVPVADERDEGQRAHYQGERLRDPGAAAHHQQRGTRGGETQRGNRAHTGRARCRGRAWRLDEQQLINTEGPPGDVLTERQDSNHSGEDGQHRRQPSERLPAQDGTCAAKGRTRPAQARCRVSW